MEDWEREARREWGERIAKKAEQIEKGWALNYKGTFSLQEALTGVLASWYGKEAIPRVSISDREGSSEEGLKKVLNKILGVMRTPTYQTINHQDPRAVNLAQSLCLKDSITGGCPERDASYALNELAQGRAVTYWDEGRDLPQYAGKIMRSLFMQFGSGRVTMALKENSELGGLLVESGSLGQGWNERLEAIRGTTSMDALEVTELGFMQLEDYWPNDSKVSEEEALHMAIDGLVAEKNRERAPYRVAQHDLRGIPVTMGTC